MKQFFTIAFVVLVPLLAIDAVWLSLTAKRFYAAHIGHLISDTPKLWVAGIFYIIYALGIAYFVVAPGIASGAGILKIFFMGAFLGFIAYGAYDFTNHATLKNWPVIVTIVDLAWGSILTGVASVIATMLMRRFF